MVWRIEKSEKMEWNRMVRMGGANRGKFQNSANLPHKQLTQEAKPYITRFEIPKSNRK